MKLEAQDYYTSSYISEGKTYSNLIEYLNRDSNKIIIEDDGKINIENLLGQKLSTGNGSNGKDIYKLEVLSDTSTGKIRDTKIASKNPVKIANNSSILDSSYWIVYYDKKETQTKVGAISEGFKVVAKDIADVNVQDIEDAIPDLEHKSLDQFPGYIPIYTAQQFVWIGLGNYNSNTKITTYPDRTIYDLNNNEIGTYKMEPSSKYVLMNNISFNNGTSFSPRTLTNTEFDGNGYSISNVNCSNTYIEYYVGNNTIPNSLSGSGNGIFNSLNNTTVKNLIVKNCTFVNPLSIGVIVGTAYGNTTIDNCYVKDCIAESSLNYACGSIVGAATNNLKINNCFVSSTAVRSNTKVNSTLTNKVNAGGIVGGYYGGDCTISNCKVLGYKNQGRGDTFSAGIIDCFSGAKLTIDSCTVQGITSSTSGVANNVVSGQADIKNCVVKDSTCGISGFVNNLGDANITNCIVKNTKVSIAGFVNKWEADNKTISNCHAQDFEGNTGIINVARGTNLDITNCTVKNAKVNYAGIIGSVLECNNFNIKNCSSQNISSSVGMINYVNSINATITDCSVKNASFNYAGIIGTFQGDKYKMEKCIIQSINAPAGMISFVGFNKEAIIKDCVANDVTVDTSAIVRVAGNYNKTGENLLKITDCKLEKVKKESNANTYEYFGGVLCSVNGNNEVDEIIIDNCTANEMKIIAGNNNAGCIAGYLNNAKISNCKVSNSSIIVSSTNIRNYGGIVGITQNSSIKDSTVNKLTIAITGKEWVQVGGIVGFSMDEIRGCNVINSNLKIIDNKEKEGNVDFAYLGGIAGYGTNVNNCSVKGTLIDSTGYTQYGTGGIVGQAGTKAENSSVSNCTVDDCTVTGYEGVGGIVGVAANNITDCKVIGTKVLGNGNYVGGIQGDGGKTESPRVLTNNTLTKCTIKGNEGFDFIEGRISYKEDENGNKTPNTDSINGCTYDSETTKGSIN